MAPNAVDVGDPAVLDILPDPGLRMDRHFGTRGVFEPNLNVPWIDVGPPDHSEHAHRRLYRDCLHISAFYDFTDLFGIGKTGR